MTPLATLLCRTLLAFSVLMQVATAHAAPSPVEAFFGDPVFSQAVLSPDGQRVAFLTGAPGARLRLAVYEAATAKASVVAQFAEHDVQSVRWASHERLLYRLASNLDGPGFTYTSGGLFSVNVQGEEARNLVATQAWRAVTPPGGRDPLPPGAYLIDGQWPQASEDVLIARSQGGNQERSYHTLYRVNARTGKREELDIPRHSSHWLFDAKGEAVAAVGGAGEREELFYHQPAKGWQKVAEGPRFGGHTLLWPTYAAANGALYGVGPGPGGHAAVYQIDQATGKALGPPLLTHTEFDLSGVQFIGNQNGLLGLRFHIDAQITHWLDPAMKALQDKVDKLLPQTSNQLSVATHGESPFVMVRAFADVQPTLTYLLDTRNSALKLLGRSHPQIRPAEMGATDFFRVKARDGLTLPTYLTLPPGEHKKKLPMVLLVHGGPWVRGMTWEWRPEVQFLASRGYAVLQPEFRGSTGFGHQHFAAGFKQWGRAMQDDLADAVKWAVDQGVADPERVCIMGSSYGGYAALMGLARDGAMFRCGVALAAVTDMALMANAHWSDASPAYQAYGLPLLVGDPNHPSMREVSPLHLAAKITQPLLLAHGGWDVRVPPEHGRRLRDAVAPHNPQLQWVEYPEEGHALRKVENRLDFYRRVEKFLADNLAVK